jgi:hypothetical protein
VTAGYGAITPLVNSVMLTKVLAAAAFRIFHPVLSFYIMGIITLLTKEIIIPIMEIVKEGIQ